MGPGAAIKAVADEQFSLITFGMAQIAMDIEPLARILRGDRILHGLTHTYVGAGLIGAIVLVFGRPLAGPLLEFWRGEVNKEGAGWLAGHRTLGWLPAATGAFVGTFSHVALDSLMHADIRPFAPFSASNGLLGVVSVGSLHRWCVLAGAIGLAVWVVRRYVSRTRGNYRAEGR
jgi:hypothetical protein